MKAAGPDSYSPPATESTVGSRPWPADRLQTQRWSWKEDLFHTLLQPLTRPFPALEVTVRPQNCGTHHRSVFITKATWLLRDRVNTTVTGGIPTACLVYLCARKPL